MNIQRTHTMPGNHRGKYQTMNLNDLVHSGISDLAKRLRTAGLSTVNCMIVVRTQSNFFVASTGEAAMNHDSAAEDFGRMIRASFDDDEKTKKFLLNILRDIREDTKEVKQ